MVSAETIEVFVAAQKALLAEIKKANEAIKRGGRTEEFRYEPNEQPGNGNLLTAKLTLSDGSASFVPPGAIKADERAYSGAMT